MVQTINLEKYHDKIKTAYEASTFTKGIHPEPEDALKQFEARYAPIPVEYRWLLLHFGGCYLAEPWIFTLKELEEGYPIFQDAYEEYMSKCEHGPAFPIGGLGDGSIVFLDLESGRVRGYNCDYADLEEIAESFSSLLLDLVEQALELERSCGELWGEHMAKGIRERLLEQAETFHRWQETAYPGKSSEEIGGAWEVDYPAWNDIFDAFCHVLTDLAAEQAEKQLLTEMLYLIARDNEGESLIRRTVQHPAWFEVLCRCAVQSLEPEAQWQFAAYLPECPCSRKIKDLILDFAKDSHEYVSRRALLAMPALRPDCVEQFAPLFWERNCYSPELQEYQRIAVLVSLDAIHSSLLPQYLDWAKQDGRSYLLEHAKRIERGLAMNETLASPAYHGFLPPHRRERQIDLAPCLYTQRGEKIHLTFLPLRPDCGNDPQWEDWNCYRSILTIGWPDCERLLLPTLKQIFPVKDPANGEIQEEFDSCFDNWIGKEDWERWIRLVRDSLPSRTEKESAFLRSILEWIETALTYTSVIVAEGNL